MHSVHQFAPMEQVFSDLAESGAVSLSIPNGTGFSRKEIAASFHQAFQIIGGVPRLAEWADVNPGKFYSLYAKLLPAQSLLELGEGEAVTIIRHAIPRTRLDQVTLTEDGTVLPPNEDA